MELELKKQTQVLLIHLTDTYFIQEIKVGSKIEIPGFARIGSLIDDLKTPAKKTLILHSGDFLFPSFMSKFFHGKQMIEMFNECKFDYITLGNHDFDGGITVLKKRLQEARFKIILTNLKPPKNFPIKFLSHKLWPKQKPILAILGISGISTQRAAKENSFFAQDVFESLNKKIKFLKDQHPQVRNLVVMSHMSDYEDKNLKKWLSKNWSGFSYIFGGHDHNNLVSCQAQTANSILIKSQSNARTVRLYSIIQTKSNFRPEKTKTMATKLKNSLVTLNSKDFENFSPSKKIQKKIENWENRLNALFTEKSKIIKTFSPKVSLDATEFSLRNGTTNFGNFIADCLCEATKSDIALINSGHFRGDRKLSNLINTGDLRRIFVMDEPGSIIKVKLFPKECRLLLLHGFKELGKGKILQMSKNCPKIIKNTKTKLSVTLMTDMIFTDDDGFAKILANQRGLSVDELRNNMKKFRINQTILDLVKRQAKFVKYDPCERFSVKKASKF